jgi:hypothetical protein
MEIHQKVAASLAILTAWEVKFHTQKVTFSTVLPAGESVGERNTDIMGML